MDWDASTQRFALGLLEVCGYKAVRLTPEKFSFSWVGSISQLTDFTSEELRDEDILKRFFGSTYNDWRYHLNRVLDSNICYKWEHQICGFGKESTVRHKLGRLDDSTVVGTLQHVPPITFEQDVALQLEVLEHLPVGVYFIDSEYRVQWTNQLGTCQSHVNWKNHYGEICYQLPFNKGTHCDNCPVVRSLVDGERMTNELAMPNGQTWLLSAMPTYNRKGERIGAVEVVTDVSDIVAARNVSLESLKLHELQLRKQNQALMGLHSHPDIREGELDASIKVIAETAAKYLAVGIVRVWMRDKGEYICLDEYNAIRHEHHPQTDIHEHLNKVYETSFALKRQISIEDIHAANIPKEMVQIYSQFNIRSILYCPIRLRGVVIGAIVMADSKPREWKLEDASFGSSLADFAALILGLSELQESQRTMRTLLSNLPGMAFRLRSSCNALAYEFASEGCLDLTGYSADSLINNKDISFLSIIYPDDLGHFTSIHKMAENVDQPRENIFRIIRKDGMVRWVWERSRIVFRNDEYTIFEGFFHDVTERFQLQEAELANKTKVEFLATMSHEIRTPMNAILGMTHQALKTELSEKQRGYLHNINFAASHLMGIINDVLIYSKTEAGKMLLDNTTFRVEELGSALKDVLLPKAVAKGLELSLTFSDTVPEFVVGDALRISQVLSNLLNNAVKFTEKGSIQLFCEGMDGGDGTCILKFSVSDTGIGITAAQQRIIFDAFCQADPSITRKYGGAGLGLSIAKKLAELMGGDITVSSMEGKGTTIVFTCRVDVAQGVEMQTGDDTIAPPVFSAQKVLLVEDNLVNQEIARELLSDVNLDVTVVNNGQEALDILFDSPGDPPFSLVFMDLQMPVMDGYQAAHRIRNEKRYENMPIVAMTAHALESERARCMEVGMNDHLTKPVDIQALYSVLRTYLHEREIVG